MGFLIFLGIVVGIIVIIVAVKKKRKKEALESLSTSIEYGIASKIYNELKKMGYRGSSSDEPSISYDSFYGSSGCYYCFFDKEEKQKSINIYYSNIHYNDYRNGLHYARSYFDTKNAFAGYRLFGIENANIGIMVCSTDDESQEIPEYIKIAAEVIESSGYGKSTRINSKTEDEDEEE